MKKFIHIALAGAMIYGSSLSAFAQVGAGNPNGTPLPTPLPGTTPVGTINTTQLLRIMNQGNLTGSNGSMFIPVAAHRGSWRIQPENSIAAINEAYLLGMEAVEIDVRIASTSSTPFSDPNAGMVLSHDECVDRQTTGQGTLRMNPGTKCTSTGGFTATSYQGLSLRDRRGNVTGSNAPTFGAVLAAFHAFQSHDSSGNLLGPILIVDLKDKDLGETPTYDAWSEYKLCISIMESVLTDPTDRPAVLFKLKMSSQIPDPSTLASELANHPTYGHIVLTIVPEDAASPQAPYGPQSNYFQQLLSYSNSQNPAVQQFELVAFDDFDDAQKYLQVANPLRTFATYYQPSYYPEGVTTRFAKCCSLAPLIQSETSDNQVDETDLRGILDFSTFYGASAVNTITSDNLLETLNYLNALGGRDTSLIMSPQPGSSGVQ